MGFAKNRDGFRRCCGPALLAGLLSAAAPALAQSPSPPTMAAPNSPLPGSPLPGPSMPPEPTAGAAAPRQLVADVQIKGNTSTNDYQIQKHIQTRQDREFDPELVQGDVRRLMTSGLFRDVRTYTQPSPEGVIVIYELFERPSVKYIRHIGNRGMSEKKLIKEHGIKVGDALNAYTCEEGRRRIEELYLRGGYPNAQVTLMEGDKPGDKGVVFLINEGQIERIASVSFEGNTIATDARLKTQIESKPGILWYFFKGKVDRQKIDADIEKLTAYYRSLGYFRARIGRELTLDESGKWVDLKFIIDEGPRYVVRNVTMEGNAKFATEPLLDYLELKAGEFYNQAEMNKDINTLIDLYGSQGHVFADVQADPRFLEEPGQLDLVYRVKEGDVFRVGEVNVHIAGEFPHTRDSVVLNRLSLRPGDIIDMREIRASERRLKASQLFETNPQEGEAPRIIVRPPDLNSVGGVATVTPQNTAVRGQSPDVADEPRQYYRPQPDGASVYGQPAPSRQQGPSTLYSWEGPRQPQPASPHIAAPQPQSIYSSPAGRF